MEKIIKSATKYTKNPLGIIALFIILIYGIAGYVLGTSEQNLTNEHKTVLVYFLILFPVMVLLVFTYLVIFHHTKLYGPSDFDDESNFINLNDSNYRSIISDYTTNLNNQLRETKYSITALEQQGGDQTQELNKIKSDYSKLESEYYSLKDSLVKNISPSIFTVVSSADISQKLAEETATASAIIKTPGFFSMIGDTLDTNNTGYEAFKSAVLDKYASKHKRKKKSSNNEINSDNQ